MSSPLSAIDQKTNTAETRSNLLAPKLRFEGFDGEWEMKILGEVSVFLDGRRKPIKSEDRAKMKGEFPYYGASGIIDYVNNFLFDEEIILLGEDGENILSRNLPLAFRVSGKCWVNNHAHVIKPNPETNIDFLTHNLEKINYVIYNTGTAQPKLNQQVCRNIPSYFPTLPEQQKIASFLSAVDEKIQQLTRKKELLEQYKKGVMQQLFSGELRFKDEHGKDFPDWEMVGGNKLFDSISDKKHNSDLPILAITQDQGAIPRDLINYQMSVTDSSIASYKVVQVGDFIISLRTFQGGIEYSNYKGICSPAYNILRPNSENVHRDFYRYYLKTENYIKQLQKNLEGIRDGKMISYKYFSEIKLPFPSAKEQQKIASYLSSLDTKIESVSNQITQTQTYKKGLLQQMFV